MLGRFRWTRFITRSIFWLLTVLFALALLFMIPNFQSFVGKKASAWLSKELNSKISIDRIQYRFFDRLVLQGLLVEGQAGDTIAIIPELRAYLSSFSIKRRNVLISVIKLDHPYINLNKNKGDSVFNYSFIEDYFTKPTTEDKSSKSFWLGIQSIDINKGYFKFSNKAAPDLPGVFNERNIIVRDFDLMVSDLLVDGVISANIRNFSATERGGLKLNHLSGDFLLDSGLISLRNFNIKTPKSDLKGNASLEFSSFRDFDDFDDLVIMKGAFEPSILCLSDLSTFSDELTKLSDPFKFQGTVKGPLSSLKGKEMLIEVGDKTTFKGSGSLMGLPKVSTTIFDIEADHLVLYSNDLEHFYTGLVIPREVKLLGYVQFAGSYFGLLNDFVANGNFITQKGNAQVDLNLKLKGADTEFSGFLATSGFDIQEISKVKELGIIAFEGTVAGKGNTVATLKADLNVTFSRVDVNNYPISNGVFKGNIQKSFFEGELQVKDPEVDMMFFGTIDFARKLPFFDFLTQIENLNLQALGFSEDTLKLKTIATMCFSGSNVDNLIGEADVDQFVIQQNAQILRFNEINLSISEDENLMKKFNLNSDAVLAEVEGFFKPSEIVTELQNLAAHHVPSLVQVKNFVPKAKFDYKIEIIDARPIIRFITGEEVYAKDFTLNGNFNGPSKELFFTTVIPGINYQNFMVDTVLLSGNTVENTLRLGLNVDEIYFKDSLISTSNSLNANLLNNHISLALAANGGVEGNSINIELDSDFGAQTVSFVNSYVYATNARWDLEQTGLIQFTDTSLFINQLKLFNVDHYIQFAGEIGKNENKEFNLLVHDFDLDYLNPFISALDLRLEGVLEMDVKARGLLASPILYGNVDFYNLLFDGEFIGDVAASADWKRAVNLLELKAVITRDGENNMDISGNLDFAQKDVPIDLKAKIQNLTAKPLDIILSPILTNFSGRLSGEMEIGGTLKVPEITGFANVNDMGFKVDYLNTFYTANGRILFGTTFIDFNNSHVSDGLLGTGQLNGRFTHKGFKESALNLRIDCQNMLVLGTTDKDNDLFYGTAYGTGYAEFIGPTEDIDIKIVATTNRNTKFFIPLDNNEFYSNSDFVTFLSEDSTAFDASTRVDYEGISLSMEITATPDAEVSIIFDKVAGDVIKGTGNGLLNIDIDKLGAFTMSGAYTIDQGEYLFTFENLINKRFKINQGGTIRWNGDPYNAQINLEAIYTTRAQLSTLKDPNSSLDITDPKLNSRTPVEVYLKMKGELMQPDLSFEIQVPALANIGSIDPIAAQIQYINNNQQELNTNVFGLLMLNQFVPQNSFVSPGLSSGVNSVSELLSNQVSNLFNNYFQNLNVGVNYRGSNATPNTTLPDGTPISSRSELQVELNRAFFNNKLIIDGNVDVGNSYLQQRNQAIGAEFTIEYILTEQIRAKAFNKIDDRITAIQSSSNYRQGAGITYRKDFDEFYELLDEPNNYIKRIFMPIAKLFGIEKKITPIIEDEPNS